MKEGLNRMTRKKQRQCTFQLFERFLSAHASARYLCREVGMDDLANNLVPVLSALQEAHVRLVTREANRVLIQIVKGIRAKVVSVDQAQELFQLDGVALNALLDHLDAPPKQDLASHLSHERRRARAKGIKENT